jgi:hypothetical protein
MSYVVTTIQFFVFVAAFVGLFMLSYYFGLNTMPQTKRVDLEYFRILIFAAAAGGIAIVMLIAPSENVVVQVVTTTLSVICLALSFWLFINARKSMKQGDNT